MALYRLLAKIRTVRRSIRRLVVLGTFLGYPLTFIGYSALVEHGALSRAVWAPIAVALMSLTIFGSAATYVYSRDRAAYVAHLDEREAALRDRAWALSDRTLSSFIALGGLCWAVYVVIVGPLTIGADALPQATIGVALYLTILPSSVLAWIEPEPLPEDPAVAA